MKYISVIANVLFVLWLIASAIASYQERNGWALLFDIVMLLLATLLFGISVGSATP